MSYLDYQVDRHNNEFRHVRELSSLRFSTFLRESGYGNMLILGGEREDRRAAVLAVAENIRQERRRPVILFTGDPLISRGLMEFAAQGRVGRLCLISREHPNYDFFSSMNAYFITEYFGRLALLRGVRDTSKLLSFTGALLEVLAGRGVPLTLENIDAFLQNSDNDIALASDSLNAQLLQGAPDGGVMLRSLVQMTRNSMGQLYTPGASTGFSLHAAVTGNVLVCVECQNDLHEIYAEYFAAELRSLIGQAFAVIFDDDLLAANPDMKTCIRSLQQDINAEVILSYGNLSAFDSNPVDFIHGFQRHLIFLHGDMPTTDLRMILSAYGQYSEMRNMQTDNAPPTLLYTLRRGKQHSPVTYNTDRVLLQRIQRFDALLLPSAPADELLLTKDLII